MDDNQVLKEIMTTIGRVDGRQEGIQHSIERIEVALFGNGKPGLKTEVEMLGKHVEHIEKRVVVLENAGCADQIAEINRRHIQEDHQLEEVEEVKEKDQDAFRSFRWWFIMILVTIGLNIIIELLIPGLSGKLF